MNYDHLTSKQFKPKHLKLKFESRYRTSVEDKQQFSAVGVNPELVKARSKQKVLYKPKGIKKELFVPVKDLRSSLQSIGLPRVSQSSLQPSRKQQSTNRVDIGMYKNIDCHTQPVRPQSSVYLSTSKPPEKLFRSVASSQQQRKNKFKTSLQVRN